MNRAIVDGDLVIGFTSGDVYGPDIAAPLLGVAMEHLRYINGKIIDASTRREWFIDEFGRKHAVRSDPNWQTVTSAIDGPLTKTNGKWRAMSASESLAELKSVLKSKVDALAEQALSNTLGPALAMVYDEKFAEAQRLAADPEPVSAKYPLLAASLGVQGETLTDVAEAVVKAKADWIPRAAAVEKKRLAHRTSIDAAATPAAAIAAYESGRSNW